MVVGSHKLLKNMQKFNSCLLACFSGSCVPLSHICDSILKFYPPIMVWSYDVKRKGIFRHLIKNLRSKKTWIVLLLCRHVLLFKKSQKSFTMFSSGNDHFYFFVKIVKGLFRCGNKVDFRFKAFGKRRQQQRAV